MRVSLYILLALAVLVVAAITRMPASIAVNQILQRVNLPADITIRYTKGTIWEGQTQLTFRTFPSLTLRWDIDAFHSFSALPVEIEAVSPASRLSGLVKLDTEAISISDLSFSLASSDINQLAATYGHRLESDINGQGIGGVIGQTCIRALTGQVIWSGGLLSIDTGGGATGVQTPALDGTLTAKDCGASLSLRAAEQTSATATLSLDQTGWLKASISPALVSLVTNEPVRGPMQFEAKIR
jgi:hypothetical protein